MLKLIVLVTCLEGQQVTEAPPPPGDYYVDPAGNDQNSGTQEEPYRTLQRARDEVRKRLAGDPKADLTVMIRGGTYELNEPLIFEQEDSGTLNASVTYIAYPGETPVISGGRKVTGWKKGEGHLWVTEIPQVKEGKWYFRQLFVDGQRRQRARTPTTGFLRIQGPSSQDKPFRLAYKPGDIKREWAARGDVEVVALLAWAEVRMQIRAVDEGKSVAILSGDPRPSNRENDARYYVENAPDGLDAPGEWRLDRETGVLSYWPMPGEDMASAEVVAPVLGELLRIEGDPLNVRIVKKLHFRGLTFAHTDWTLDSKGYADTQAAVAITGAFTANGLVDGTIEKCVFSHLGNYGVQLLMGCQRNRIVGNEFFDLGAGGVKVGEVFMRPNKDELTVENVVSDNSIHDCGQVYHAAVGIWIGQSSNNIVAHNEIHDLYYTAISAGWTWGYGTNACRGNTIESNHLYNVGRNMLSDLGGIYTLGAQPGTVLRNNLIHDVSSFTYGGWGIYTDEGSSQIVIENNIVYRCKSAGFHQHYGRENTVRHNIFALNSENQLMRTRAEGHRSFSFEHNIVYWTTGNLLGSNWSDNNYSFDHNVYWLTGGREFRFANWTFSEWKQKGQDKSSAIVDPLFVNVTGDDFTLRPESPALKMGFKPIDPREVGPRPQYRKGKAGEVPEPSTPPPSAPKKESSEKR